MPESPNVLIAVGRAKKGHIPQQNYKNIFTQYNMASMPLPDASFYTNMAQGNGSIGDVSDFHIYGFMPGNCKYTYDYSIQRIVDFFQRNDKVEVVICDHLEIQPNVVAVYKSIHPSQLQDIPFFIKHSIRHKINFNDEQSLFKNQLSKLQQEHIIFHVGEPLISFVQESSG